MEDQNALAGPSNPPPYFAAPPPYRDFRPLPFNGTEDLFARFNLYPAYEKHVRPHLKLAEQSQASAVKGKGKQVATPGADGGTTPMMIDEEGVGQQGEKKKKGLREQTYRYLISNVPGKHSLKKDSFLRDTIYAPPKDPVKMKPFDASTLRAFVVEGGGLTDFNPLNLFGEDEEQRKMKKKKKKIRKQQQEALAAMQSQSQPHTNAASTPLPMPARQPSVSSTQAPTPTHYAMAPQQRTMSMSAPLPQGKVRKREETPGFQRAPKKRKVEPPPPQQQPTPLPS